MADAQRLTKKKILDRAIANSDALLPLFGRQIEAHEDDINTVAYADSACQIFFSGSDDQLVKVRLFAVRPCSVHVFVDCMQYFALAKCSPWIVLRVDVFACREEGFTTEPAEATEISGSACARRDHDPLLLDSDFFSVCSP